MSLSAPPAIARHRPQQPSDAPMVGMVSVDRVEFHPANIRKDLGDLRALTESIREHGVIEPLRVERRPGARMLRVIYGHRRLTAARLAGRKRVPALIVPERSTEDAVLEMLTEIGHRVAVPRDDRAAAIRRLRDEFGLTVREIAARCGVSEVTVYAWQVLEPRPVDNGATEAAGDGGQVPAQRAASRPRKPSAPRIRPTAVHELTERWAQRTAEVAPDEAAELLPELIEEMRGLLGEWRPARTGVR